MNKVLCLVLSLFLILILPGCENDKPVEKATESFSIQDDVLPQKITDEDMRTANEFYEAVLNYINGICSFEDANRQINEILSNSNSTAVLSIPGISGVQTFFCLVKITRETNSCWRQWTILEFLLIH